MISVTESGLNWIDSFRQKRAVGKTKTYKIKKFISLKLIQFETTFQFI